MKPLCSTRHFWGNRAPNWLKINLNFFEKSSKRQSWVKYPICLFNHEGSAQQPEGESQLHEFHAVTERLQR
jgi:hypothetical protein